MRFSDIEDDRIPHTSDLVVLRLLDISVTFFRIIENLKLLLCV